MSICQKKKKFYKIQNYKKKKKFGIMAQWQFHFCNIWKINIARIQQNWILIKRVKNKT